LFKLKNSSWQDRASRRRAYRKSRHGAGFCDLAIVVNSVWQRVTAPMLMTVIQKFLGEYVE
jgi:hypothetical protein